MSSRDLEDLRVNDAKFVIYLKIVFFNNLKGIIQMVVIKEV